MSRLFYFCGQNRTILSKFGGQPSILKSAICYKPIDAICRYAQIRSRAHLATRAPLNLNPTALTKDIIVFKYENPKYFKIMNIFAIVQFFFWTYCGQFTLSSLRDVPVNSEQDNYEDLPWYSKINLGSNKYRNGITVICFAVGFGILAFAWTFTLRSVRFLILRKGGREVSFVTYGPMGTNRILTVPLDKVSGQESRSVSKSLLPIKVKNVSWFYVLDARGEYLNKDLFDHVINVRRRI